MSRSNTSASMAPSMQASERANAAHWHERQIPVSISTAVAYKNRERAELQAHLNEFLRRHGRIQLLPNTLGGAP